MWDFSISNKSHPELDLKLHEVVHTFDPSSGEVREGRPEAEGQPDYTVRSKSA